MHGVTPQPVAGAAAGCSTPGIQSLTRRETRRIYLLGLPEDNSERRQRWWAAGPFLVAALAAILLGDQPADLSGLVIAVAAAWAALYACVPLSGVRVGVSLVGVAFLCWGVAFVADGATWQWNLLDAGQRPGGSAVAAVIGVLALVVSGGRDIGQLRTLPLRAAADGQPEELSAVHTDGAPIAGAASERCARVAGTGDERQERRRATSARLACVVVGVAMGLLLARRRGR